MGRFAAVLLAVAFAGAPPLVAAEPAPDFRLPGREGTVTLADLTGQVVYVDFWASWCTPCRRSFPWMNAMQQRYGKDGFTVIAVNLDKDRALAERFLTETAPRFTVAFDPDGKTAAAYKVKGMPSSYLVDRTGNLVTGHVGFREKEKDAMEEAIRQLVKGERQ